jgi:hypothetical protein
MFSRNENEFTSVESYTLSITSQDGLVSNGRSEGDNSCKIRYFSDPEISIEFTTDDIPVVDSYNVENGFFMNDWSIDV